MELITQGSGLSGTRRHENTFFKYSFSSKRGRSTLLAPN